MHVPLAWQRQPAATQGDACPSVQHASPNNALDNDQAAHLARSLPAAAPRCPAARTRSQCRWGEGGGSAGARETQRHLAALQAGCQRGTCKGPARLAGGRRVRRTYVRHKRCSMADSRPTAAVPGSRAPPSLGWPPARTALPAGRRCPATHRRHLLKGAAYNRVRSTGWMGHVGVRKEGYRGWARVRRQGGAPSGGGWLLRPPANPSRRRRPLPHLHRTAPAQPGAAGGAARAPARWAAPGAA